MTTSCGHRQKALVSHWSQPWHTGTGSFTVPLRLHYTHILLADFLYTYLRYRLASALFSSSHAHMFPWAWTI